MEYRCLNTEEINTKIFSDFVRHQNVTKCYRRENSCWKVKEDPFIDDWTPDDYKKLISDLRRTANSGGFVYAALLNGNIKGFVSVESEIFDEGERYMDLSSIHVSEESRGFGIGTKLFYAAADFARKKGAKKLYISSHSALESQIFYRGLGCVDAKIPNKKHVEKEPFDCQLEYKL